MPPARKRQKTVAATRPPGLAARGIYDFGRIVKVESTQDCGAKKRKIESTDDINGRSSKLVKIEDGVGEEGLSTLINRGSDTVVAQALLRSSAGLEPPKRNIKGARKSTVRSHLLPEEGRASIKSLLAASSVSVKPDTPAQLPSDARTSSRLLLPASPSKTTGCSSEVLPEALEDLINLHSSFLTALSLYHAHHGSMTPADLQLLIPSIERAWGKRRVTTDDIRRTLGILEITQLRGDALNHKESRIKLSDYGNGKICVEVLKIQESSSLGRLLDTNDLNAEFTRNLHEFWKDWTSSNKQRIERKPQTTDHESGSDLEDRVTSRSILKSEADFIQQLPMSIIHICSSLEKVAPLLTRRQKRYKEFKVAAARRDDSKRPQAGRREALDRGGVEIRGKSLLERIRAKALHQSTLPPPPSKDMLQRTSALQRLDEVISVLVHLSTSGFGLSGIKRHSDSAAGSVGVDENRPLLLPDFQSTVGRQRVSFPLSALVVYLKNSLTNPISKEEAEQCVRLLAEEVAPDWVNTVTSGKVVAVIVNKGARAGVAGWKSRVKM